MRVVFDTNIFVSAFVISGSLAERAVLRIIEGGDTLIVSREILDELLGVLSRKFSRDAEQLSRVAVVVSEMGEMVKGGRKIKVLQDDPDNRVLECAAAGRADLIVTGDRAMLGLKTYKGIRIITLKNYLAMGPKA